MSIFQQFNNMFPVRRDIGSLRKKGVLLEQVQEWVDQEVDLQPIRNEIIMIGGVAMEELMATTDKQYGCYWFGSRMGIPTLVIGAASEEKWIELRTKLRAAKLVR